MDKTFTQKLLVQAGAIQYGHFRLASGLHSDIYIDKDSLSANTRILSLLCQGVAQHFMEIRLRLSLGLLTAPLWQPTSLRKT